VGYGQTVLGVITAAVLLFTLEVPYASSLRRLDARTYSQGFRDGHAPDSGSD
jgi:hypothetical protein